MMVSLFCVDPVLLIRPTHKRYSMCRSLFIEGTLESKIVFWVRKDNNTVAECYGPSYKPDSEIPSYKPDSSRPPSTFFFDQQTAAVCFAYG